MPEASGAVRQCLNGHVLEPDWQICPYCPSNLPAIELASAIQVPSASTGSPSASLPATARVPRAGEWAAAAGLAPTIRVDEAVHADLPPELAKTVMVEASRQAMPAAQPSTERRTEFMRRPPVMAEIGWLVSIAGKSRGRMLSIERDRVVVGASAECDAVIDSPDVSEKHASIRYRDDGFVVTDLDSTNGTFVNGEPIHKQGLADGDLVRFGASEWVFKSVKFDDA